MSATSLPLTKPCPDCAPTSPPPVIPCCRVDECWALYLAPGDVGHGPCWGQSSAIDEDYGDWGHDFIHGCEGHPERFGAYEAPPGMAMARRPA